MSDRVRTGPTRRFGVPARAAAVLALALLAGCGDRDGDAAGGADVPVVRWESGLVEVHTENDTLPLSVEIAETDEQRAYGLMHRDRLPENAGMIFLYPDDQPAESGFWMFNTRIPLDIAFADAEGRIVSIRQMEPCTSPYPQWCPSYAAGAPFRSALEVNHGWFARNGVAVGDRVLLNR